MDFWEKLLPDEYRNSVIPPIFFESHMDPTANAVKYIGFDSHARRCFYLQSFVMTEEGFDVDEFPILIDVYYERVVAWKLNQGGWIKVKSFTDQLDRCNKHVTTLPVEMTSEMPR
jgi:hypothetical protein